MNLQPPLLIQSRWAFLSCLRFIRGAPPVMAAAALLLASALVGVRPAAGAQDAPKPNQAEAPKQPQEQEAKASGPAEYMTSAVCQGCHEDIYNAFMKRNPHRIVETSKKRGFEEKACESCHGPGSKHAESTSPDDIINPSRIKPSAANRVCLTCHLNTQTQVGRVMGGHARNQVRCTECHSIHAAPAAASAVAAGNILPGSVQGTVSQRTAQRTATCVRCHTNTWAEFQRPFRHNLPEGSMNCTDCHNPHGGPVRSMWSNASMREPGCFQCHGDKRGPFTFEHAPVRMEGCVACHQPHGSANPRMLTRHETRFVCLECHSNIGAVAAGSGEVASNTLGGVPPAFHDLRSPRYRNCAVCHIKIHGSYVNKGLTR